MNEKFLRFFNFTFFFCFFKIPFLNHCALMKCMKKMIVKILPSINHFHHHKISLIMCDAKSTLLRSAFCKSFSICNFSSTAIWAIHTFLQRGVSLWGTIPSLSNCRHLSISQTNLVPFREKIGFLMYLKLAPLNVCSIFSKIELKSWIWKVRFARKDQE